MRLTVTWTVLVLATAITVLGAEPKYLLERVDDAAVVQLYADGFSRLPLNQKVLVWHLDQAAIAGRNIHSDQLYTHGLERGRRRDRPRADGRGAPDARPR
jgi:dipeptidyl-peptidase III